MICICIFNPIIMSCSMLALTCMIQSTASDIRRPIHDMMKLKHTRSKIQDPSHEEAKRMKTATVVQSLLHQFTHCALHAQVGWWPAQHSLPPGYPQTLCCQPSQDLPNDVVGLRPCPWSQQGRHCMLQQQDVVHFVDLSRQRLQPPHHLRRGRPPVPENTKVQSSCSDPDGLSALQLVKVHKAAVCCCCVLYSPDDMVIEPAVIKHPHTTQSAAGSRCC
jgi:hypothetical protein